MLNIIKSDFYKLKKNKAFWICVALCVIFGILMVVAIQADMSMELQKGINNPMDSEYLSALAMSEQVSAIWALEYFLPLNFNTLIVGIFIAVFITSEFSYGTIKNTLSRGADRTKVFLSKFLVCGVAAVIMQILFITALIATGSVIWGFDPHGVASLGSLISVILSQLLVIVGFAALFTFISTTIRANGGSIMVNILCSTVISSLFSALGLLFGLKIAVNDYWLGGIVSKLATVTPAAGDVSQGIIVTLVWGIASLLAGTMLFQKMDVK